ncbi:HAMP domain-containing methyl-accepting chemotaxis protein [Sedimenticola hydrogenitrophicus]|uniref:HAMP domain-containing methyl-accepting chemotaxis protein n=1 Tax=Sedimenticola hydrogenitrophicus TaxID=2967975 RepID=UPI0021A299AF|nr:methyl-accepting chemotaxis protein [Sedimenticola hydrogenitrophicus]
MKIRHKIWAGFAVLLAIIAAISVQTLNSLNNVKHSVVEMVEIRQPTTLLSKELSARVHQTASALGFFLSTKEESHRTGFLQGLKESEALVQQLKQLRAVTSDSQSMALVEGLSGDLARFRTLGDRLLDTATSYEKNFPGIAFANTDLNPMSRVMVQLTSQMIASEQEEEATPERRALLTQFADLRYAWSNVMSSIRGYLAFRSDAVTNDLKLYLERTEQLLSRLAEHEDELTLDQADSLQQFQSQLVTYQANIDKMMQIHGGDQWRTDAWLVRSEATPLFQEIDNKLNALESLQSSAIAETNTTLVDETNQTTLTVSLLMGIGLVIGLFMAWLISRAICRPLGEVVEALDDIAHGEGDLTRRLESRTQDEIGHLALAFNTFIDKIQALVQHTASATGQVISAVAETTESTRNISRMVLAQEQETQQVATAIHEMSATISEVASNAASASEATRSATQEAAAGHKTVEETARSIQSLHREITNAANVIGQVEKNSEGIGSVLDVIKGIAEQTNLLALNAAIEAARAGEQGRGFAVVADEVRNLATRTQESAGEIEEMIRNLQHNTHQAVKAMENGCATAEENVQQANSARASLEAINAAIETINAMNRQIAVASEQQSSVSEEINRSIITISQESKSAASLSQQSMNTTAHLGQLATELQQVVRQFKITSDESVASLQPTAPGQSTNTAEWEKARVA